MEGEPQIDYHGNNYDKSQCREKVVSKVYTAEDLSISCFNCGTTKTPLWRGDSQGNRLCNMCGLYVKTHATHRPVDYRKKKKESCQSLLDPSKTTGTCPGDGNCNGTGGKKACAGCPSFNQSSNPDKNVECFNCKTKTTPLWRRDSDGNTMCNACGLHYKVHGEHRVIKSTNGVIKRRKRYDRNSHDKQSQSIVKLIPEGKIPLPNLNNKEIKKEGYETVDNMGIVPNIEDYLGPNKKKASIGVTDIQPKVLIEESSQSASLYEHPSPNINYHIYNSRNEQLSNIKSTYHQPIEVHHKVVLPPISSLFPTEHFPLHSSSQTNQATIGSNPSHYQLKTSSEIPELMAHRNELKNQVTHLTQLLKNSAQLLEDLNRKILETSPNSYNQDPSPSLPPNTTPERSFN